MLEWTFGSEMDMHEISIASWDGSIYMHLV